MKFIKFCNEVIRVPENVYFWIQSKEEDTYKYPYYVNMSILLVYTPILLGEPGSTGLIRSEGYKSQKEALARLDELLELLNK